jgi:phospholipase D1/2
MIYAMEREFFPQYKLRWKSHGRVRFCLDGEHPAGGSQHQKLVVIDDRIAFCGGIDLARCRWDTSAHRAREPRRTDPRGESYPPFHDVQMLVDGEAARVLGDLARERWQAAGGGGSRQDLQSVQSDPWPSCVAPALTDVDIGIARTFPPYEGRSQVREAEQLYLDSIAAARHFIYVENQYLSSQRVGQALAKRLREPRGPEVIIVTPEKTGGWLEQHTMDVLRTRLLDELREADRHSRLRVFFVRLSQDPPLSLMIHAKVMIVDDVFVRVGSSNLSNRSMGLDSECDLAIESTQLGSRETVRDFRRSLLAEHLGSEVGTVAKAEDAHPSLIAAIDSLSGGERSLEPLQTKAADELDGWIPDAALLDPEQPIEPDDLLEYLLGREQKKPLRRNLVKVALLASFILLLVAAWRWTPLGDWLDIDTATAAAEWLQARPFTPALVLATFLIGGTLGVPLMLMIVATVVAFGPWIGAAYALVGAELSALASFGLGRVLGRDAVSRLAGSRVNRISRKLANRGLLTTITLRIVPVAPFPVINLIAGVSEVRPRDFALGSLIGLLPGVLVSAVLTDRVVASLRDPSASVILGASIAVVLLGFGLLALRRWLRIGTH